MPMSRRSPLSLLVTLTCACGDPANGGDGSEGDSGSGSGSTSGGTVTPTATGDPSGPEPTSVADTTGGSISATQGETGDPSSGEPETTGPSPDMGGPPAQFGRCGDEPPPGATLAPEIPKYGGSCPVIETGLVDGQMPNILPQSVAGQN